MYCIKCGSPIDDNAKFCPNCGSPTSAVPSVPPAATYYPSQPQQASQPRQTAQNQTNGCVIAGFVLSFFMPLIGLILSIIGVGKAKECGNGKGLAIAGIVLSSIDIAVFILVVLLVVLPLLVLI